MVAGVGKTLLVLHILLIQEYYCRFPCQQLAYSVLVILWRSAWQGIKCSFQRFCSWSSVSSLKI